MIGLLTSRLAGPIATGGAVLLALALGIQSIRLADARHDRDEARDQVSTLTADLATSRASVENLQAGISAQNYAIWMLSAESQSRLTQAEAEVTEAQRATRAAQNRIAVLMSRPPVGETR